MTTKNTLGNAFLQNHADWYKPNFDFGAPSIKNKVSCLKINVLLTDQKSACALSCLLGSIVCIDSSPFLD